LAREYLAAKAGMRSIDQYERSLKADTLPFIGNLKAVDVTDSDIERIVTRMEARGSSAGYARAVISAIYTWAMKHRRPKLRMAGNPTKTVTTGIGESRERVLSAAEIMTLWPALGDDDGGRALRLMLMLGQRPGEVGLVVAASG
jgi:integrase